MTMISPLMKIILRPIARSIDALLERLQNQIRSGDKEQAVTTVNELREALKAGAKHLD